jgi:Tfp pilus assembly protein PilN
LVNINLLPEEARRNASRRTTGLSAWMVPLIMAAAVGMVASMMTLRQAQDARALEQEIQSLTAEKQKYSHEVALIAEVEGRRNDLARRVEAATNLDTARGGYVRQLATLNDVLPANLWLTGVTQDPGAPTVRIEGRSLGPAPVFMLMRGLERSEPFEEVNLEYLKKDPDQEQGATAFVLTSRVL